MITPSPNETLLGTSAVYLFGRLLSDVVLVKKDPDDNLRPTRKGKNNFLKDQLRNDDAGLARIFYFSYEGGLFEMARPALFLVHGGGQPADVPDNPGLERLARSSGKISKTGLGWQFGSFASDIRVWVYDKGDFSMRLDTDTGSFEQILLAAESGSSALGMSNGVMARSSGALARSSGAMARSSGAMVRRSGDVD